MVFFRFTELSSAVYLKTSSVFTPYFCAFYFKTSSVHTSIFHRFLHSNLLFTQSLIPKPVILFFCFLSLSPFPRSLFQISLFPFFLSLLPFTFSLSPFTFFHFPLFFFLHATSFPPPPRTILLMLRADT